MMMSSLPPYVSSKLTPAKVTSQRVKRAAGKFKQSISSLEKQNLPFQKFPIRLLFLFAVLVLGLLIMGGRFFWIQLIDGANLSNKARLSHESKKHQPLFRGEITDRRGDVLAQDALLYDLFAHPAYFYGQAPEEMARLLATVIPLDEGVLAEKFKKKQTTITIAKGITREQLLSVLALRISVPEISEKTNKPVLDENGQPKMVQSKLNGLDPVQKPIRKFPQGSLAAHVLGYVNDEADVASGVHSVLGNIIKKHQLVATDADKSKQLLVNGRGTPLSGDVETLRQYVRVSATNQIELTIDSHLQYIVERELRAGVLKTNAARGTVILMNPNNGELLAFASYPAFNPEQYHKANMKELKNWAMTDVYEPGSTMKILTVAMGIEAGSINEKSTILDTGTMTIGGWPIKNYDYSRHPYPGQIDLVHLFLHSSNIGSAKVALGIPKKKYRQLLTNLGFGSRTAIEMTGESSGSITPTSQWGEAQQASLGYGYGLMATPLQMITAVATVANGGRWVQPHVIKNIFELGSAKVNVSGLKTVSPLMAFLNRKPSKQVLKPSTSAAVTRLLTKSLVASPHHPANLGVVSVAGKTGTAKKSVEGGRGYSSDLYTSFIGYFPAEKPKLLAMVVIDSPHIAEAWGSTVAAPIFRNIALEAVHYYGLAPRKAISVDTPKVIVIRKQGASRSHYQGGASAHSVVPSSGQSAISTPTPSPSAVPVNQPATVGNVPTNNPNNSTNIEGNTSSPNPAPESSLIVTPTPAVTPTNPPTPAGNNGN
ncbi:MAG: penicillin-binding protein 2 [Vampirovibrio sp.]|nr:penicillin-binding protein 2 [Vampirovibrio sp.]